MDFPVSVQSGNRRDYFIYNFSASHCHRCRSYHCGFLCLCRVVLLDLNCFWVDPVRDFTTLIVFISFLGGIQLMAIGILGEYIGIIFNEVKRRPVYLLKSLNGDIPSKDSFKNHQNDLP